MFPWRSFEVYPVFTRLMNGTAVQVPLAADLGFDIAGLAAAVTERTTLMFLASPNNPTGVATAPRRNCVACSSRCRRSTIVCIDEAYREFLDPGFGDPVTDLLPDFPNVIVTRTFSKAHGLAGLRVGYGVGHPDVIATIDKTMLPFTVNALAQAAALAALEHDDEITARVGAILAERARVEVELAAAGWTLPNHQGNFVWLATGDRTDELALALERRGVVVRPFSGDGIRVTIGTPAENDRFLAALADGRHTMKRHLFPGDPRDVTATTPTTGSRSRTNEPSSRGSARRSHSLPAASERSRSSTTSPARSSSGSGCSRSAS